MTAAHSRPEPRWQRVRRHVRRACARARCPLPRSLPFRVRTTFLSLGIFLIAASPATGGIETTRHNLMVERPGERARAASGDATAGMCVFCHTPHSAAPQPGLWNRKMPAVTYKLYRSSTLQAELQQPTGTSRMCLSCHDGTLALGALRKRPPGPRSQLEPLTGEALLGTDLSDDHPISFVYDSNLATHRPGLADPSNLPLEVELDDDKQVQCTSCHDAHESEHDHFLVIDNRSSALCTSCHRIPGWEGSIHALSSATRRAGGKDPWPHSKYETVAENGCTNCHEQHGARHAEWLLAEGTQSEGCLVCHDGSVAATDVRRSLLAPSSHPVQTSEALHQPNEDPLFMDRHVTCADCHEPHSIHSASGRAAGDMAGLGEVTGVDSSGRRVERAQSEYEVCYKCHGLQERQSFQPARSLVLVRQDDIESVRLEFSSANPSYHPVETRGRNAEIEGLEASYNAASVITCSDCHNSESARTGTRGPHGSVYEPILGAEYRTADPSPESRQGYALCYNCHSRSALFGSLSGFPHQLHVVDEKASCAVCHDAHGSRNNPFLINFLLRSKTGDEVVKPPAGGQLEFTSLGRGRGRCSLTCHGKEHAQTAYPSGSAGGTPGRFMGRYRNR